MRGQRATGKIQRNNHQHRMRGQRATGKIQRNNHQHGSCGPSLTGKTSSVSLIFTHGTHRNVKNR